jgi:exodeoxyribonuclease VII large subunit
LELVEQLDRSRQRLGGGARRTLERETQRLDRAHERLRRAPALTIERKRAALDSAAGRLRALSPKATLERGYAIVRTDNAVVLSASAVAPGDRIGVELADGAFGARVES